VQLLVIGFDEPRFEGTIAAELARLRQSDIIRLVDVILVNKDENGDIMAVHGSDLSTEEAEEFGAFAGALIGFGAAGEAGLEAGAEAGAEAAEDGTILDDDQVWHIADTIPEGSAAAVALIEHRWAIPLREAIAGAGGIALADAWIHPRDLVAIGLLASEDLTAGSGV